MSMENGPQLRAEKAKHFVVVDSEGPGGGDLFMPCNATPSSPCKCVENKFVTVERPYDSIPLECLKLDPLTIKDLQEASKDIKPSASKQEVDNIDYFYKHRKLPPTGLENANGQKIQPLPSPRPPAHGFGEWLLALTVVGFVLFLIILLLKAQGRI